MLGPAPSCATELYVRCLHLSERRHSDLQRGFTDGVDLYIYILYKFYSVYVYKVHKHM